MEKIITLGVNKGHNSSVALLENDKVLFFLESERLSNIKYDRFPFQAISKIKDYVNYIDHLVITGLSPTPEYDVNAELDAYSATVLGLNKTFLDHGFTVSDFWNRHHEIHAATAFYNSGFDKALCIVKDAFGSPYWFNNPNAPLGLGKEITSSFIFEHPSKVELIQRNIAYAGKLDNDYLELDNKVTLINGYSEGLAFEEISKILGFTSFDAGKTMGLAPYGVKDPELKPFYKNNIINNDVFKYLNNDLNDNIVDIEITSDFQKKANIAYHLQQSVQEKVADYIVNILNKTNEKNLCLSGGFFLNCVSNYNLLKRIPKDINIYVEPIASDAGNSLGAAKYYYYSITQNKNKIPQKTIYYGPKYNYTLEDLKNENIIQNISFYDVAKIISEKNIVAMYQGSSEAGPRALGNRSILYDPRDINGKDHVNSVKKRESFRPFAGSVLKEYANDWFDLRQLNESKFMMFAVDVIKEKQSLIPAITHVDGTCRVQTVSEEDNINYYKLIKEFYNITGVPILFNTSFNLAGNTIVETLDDALFTLKNSKIDYLYLPEMSVLIKNDNGTI
jgi:carbamoyltransferase